MAIYRKDAIKDAINRTIIMKGTSLNGSFSSEEVRKSWASETAFCFNILIISSCNVQFTDSPLHIQKGMGKQIP